MKLLQLLFILQLISFSPVVLDEPLTTETPEEFDDDPYVHHLGSTCSWTLRMPGNRSGEAVPLPPDYLDSLTKQICLDLKCGRVYDVKKTTAPANSRCYHDCLLRDWSLQSCLRTLTAGCIVAAEVVCGHQSVRLQAGSGRCAGRVEVWKDLEWGTVCDDSWDLREAQVVCAQLGCGTALRVTGQNGLFPPGSGPIHLDDLNCTGNEQNLWFCPGGQETTDCGHKEDAGVVCSESKKLFRPQPRTYRPIRVTTPAPSPPAPPAPPPPPRSRPPSPPPSTAMYSPEHLSILWLSSLMGVFATLVMFLCCYYCRRDDERGEKRADAGVKKQVTVTLWTMRWKS